MPGDSFRSAKGPGLPRPFACVLGGGRERVYAATSFFGPIAFTKNV